MLTTLLSLRAQIENFHLIQIGIINATYFLGLYAGAKFTDRLVSRVGHGRAYAIFASIGSICALLHALLLNPYMWMVIRLGTGFCIAGLFMVTESWLNSRATRTTRGQILSMYMITHYLAAGIGQLFIPFADPEGLKLFVIAAIGFSLSLIPVLVTRLIAPPIPSRQKFNIKRNLQLFACRDDRCVMLRIDRFRTLWACSDIYERNWNVLRDYSSFYGSCNI